MIVLVIAVASIVLMSFKNNCGFLMLAYSFESGFKMVCNLVLMVQAIGVILNLGFLETF